MFNILRLINIDIYVLIEFLEKILLRELLYLWNK